MSRWRDCRPPLNPLFAGVAIHDSKCGDQHFLATPFALPPASSSSAGQPPSTHHQNGGAPRQKWNEHKEFLITFLPGSSAFSGRSMNPGY